MTALIAESFSFFVLVANLATQALGFSADAFNQAGRSGAAQSAALLIAFLAGVSEMLGQSVILVVNRVALYRFLASLAFTGATYAITVLTWGIAVLLAAPFTAMGALEWSDASAVIGVLALAFAPRLFGVFSIAPYFGVALANILEIWSMTLAMFGLYAAFDLSPEAAVICGGAGFIVSYGFRTFLGQLLASPLGRLRHAISGSSLEKSPAQIIDDIIKRIAEEAPR